MRKDQETFNRLLSMDQCEVKELRSTCGVLRLFLGLIDFGHARLKVALTPEALDYLVGKAESLPDIDEMPDCSEETMAAYCKLVSDTIQQSISEFSIHKPKGGTSLNQLGDACRQCLSEYDKDLSTNGRFDEVEVSIFEGILNRPEAAPFLVRGGMALEPGVSDTTEITEWTSFEDFMANIKKKYTVDALNSHVCSDTKSFFYKSFLQMNDGGVVSVQCLEKIDKIFRILTQDLLAIDVSEANYAKLLFLYTGKDMLGNGNDKIEWNSCINDLYCFAKYLVVDGGKFKKVEEHFLFNIGNGTAPEEKAKSKEADKSLFKGPLQKLYSELGFRRIKEEN